MAHEQRYLTAKAERQSRSARGGVEPAARLPRSTRVIDQAVVDAAVDEDLRRAAGRHAGLVVAAACGPHDRVVGTGTLPATDPGQVLFEIGSVTKVFTATLLLVMADAGEVGLDEPLQDLLPAGLALPVRGRPITLLDLATHTSGLPRLPGRWLLRQVRNAPDPYAVLDLDDVWTAAVRTRRGRPGGRTRYSNFGVGLLGHALAQRAGRSWEDLVVERVCAPLGLHDTTPGVRLQDAARAATGHDRRGRPVPHWTFPVLGAAGALVSTAADLLAFLAAQESDADTPVHRAVRATQVPHRRMLAAEVCAGWAATLRKPGAAERVLWHNGGTGGFRSFVACVPGLGVRVVVLAADNRPPDSIGQRLLSTLAPL